MTLGMYSIRDALVGYMTPVLESNDAIAMRNFAMALSQPNGPDSLMSWRPSDYDLFLIAHFDSETGALTPVSPPALVASGVSLAPKRGGD